jgi:3-hydroxybutyryl-CoA dehydrogenase
MLSKVAVLGAGTMGSGIAQWFTQCGLSVELSDNSPETLAMALERVHSSWDKLCAKGKFTSEQVDQFKKNLTTTTDFSKDCNLKTEVFQKMAAHFDKKTILATNTSSIPIDAIARDLPQDRKSKFLGLHFFNPAPIMKLVEVVAGHWSDKEIANSLIKWIEEAGKKPALCIDGPGFIVNRLARNYYGEPLRIVNSENEEKSREVDSILKTVGGFRMGPFELMDLIGIDINYSVTQSVWNSFYNEERFAPHALQRKMVTSGRLGKKTKAGFYDYSSQEGK